MTGNPAGVLGGEEDGGFGDVLRLGDSSERGEGFCPGAEIALSDAGGVQSFGFYHAGVDGIYADFPGAQFLRERNGNGIDRHFGGAVDGGVGNGHWSYDGTDVDDGTPGRTHELYGFLGGEKEAEYVEVELFVEVFGSDGFERPEFEDAGVVDQDIEAAVSLFGLLEEAGNVLVLRYVGLNRGRFAAFIGDAFYDSVGAGFTGGIVHDYGGSRSRQMFSDGGADAFRSAGYYRYLTLKIAHAHGDASGVAGDSFGEAAAALEQDKLVGEHGVAEEITLAFIASGVAENFPLAEAFNAFGDALHAETGCHLNDIFDQGRAPLAGRDGGDERPIDLEALKREVLQIRKRCLAGAKVVDRDLHAGTLERGKHSADAFKIADEDAFGEFKFEELVGEAGFGQNALNTLREAGIAKLDGGDVDGHAKPLAGFSMPFDSLFAGLAKDPQADFDDEAGFFKDRNKGGR